MKEALVAILTTLLALECFGATTQPATKPSTRPAPIFPSIASDSQGSYDHLSSAEIGHAINELEYFVREKTAWDLESMKDAYQPAKQFQTEVEDRLLSLDVRDPMRIPLASERLNIRRILSEMEEDATDGDGDLSKAKAALVQFHGILVARNAAKPYVPSPTAGTSLGSPGSGRISASPTRSLKSQYAQRNYQQSSSGGPVFVPGYYRRDGTYVHSYYRRR